MTKLRRPHSCPDCKCGWIDLDEEIPIDMDAPMAEAVLMIDSYAFRQRCRPMERA